MDNKNVAIIRKYVKKYGLQKMTGILATKVFNIYSSQYKARSYTSLCCLSLISKLLEHNEFTLSDIKHAKYCRDKLIEHEKSIFARLNYDMLSIFNKKSHMVKPTIVARINDVGDIYKKGGHSLIYEKKDIIYKTTIKNDRELTKYEIIEINIIKYCNNPYIISTKGILIHNDKFYISMPRIKYNLEEYLVNNKIDKLSIIKQLRRGIMYLHSMNIVHCDIKPLNILIEEGKIKICDFSMSIYQADITNIICLHRPTEGYIAPEFYKSINVTYKIDYWACGCTIFYIEKREIYRGILDINNITILNIINKLLKTNPAKREFCI